MGACAGSQCSPSSFRRSQARPGHTAPSRRPALRRRRQASRAGAIDAALRSGRDVWGERLLAAPGGPTYARARRYLGPLVLARAAGRTPLTDSGAYYLPFGVPAGARGAAAGVALHLADGSEIVARRVGGPALTVSVGPGGGERYGSCRATARPSRSSPRAGCRSSRRGYVDGARRALPAGVVHGADAGRARELRPVERRRTRAAARAKARAVVRFPGGSISVPVRGARGRSTV